MTTAVRRARPKTPDLGRPSAWEGQGACRSNPELFFTTKGGAPSRSALHLCHVHCPVLEDCRALAATWDRTSLSSVILAGVAYGVRGKPLDIDPWASCQRCAPMMGPDPDYQHGTLKGAGQHRARAEPLCGKCRKAERDKARRSGVVDGQG